MYTDVLGVCVVQHWGGPLGFVCGLISHPPCSWRGSCNSALRLPSCIPLSHNPPASLILSQQGALAEREGAWVLQREKHPKVSVKWQERCQRPGSRSLLFLTACSAGLGVSYRFPFLPSYFFPFPSLVVFRKGKPALKGEKEQRCLSEGPKSFVTTRTSNSGSSLLWAKWSVCVCEENVCECVNCVCMCVCGGVQ